MEHRPLARATNSPSWVNEHLSMRAWAGAFGVGVSGTPLDTLFGIDYESIERVRIIAEN